MRPHGTQAELEKRRRQAIELLKQGKASLSAVARWVGASKSSVSRWYQAYQKDGSKALRSKEIPGRPPKLSAVQKTKLEQQLLKGPLVAGYRTLCGLSSFDLAAFANICIGTFSILIVGMKRRLRTA